MTVVEQLLTDIKDLLIEIRNQGVKVTRPREPKDKSSLPILARLWNEKAHPSLPRVMGMSPSSKRLIIAHARWKEKPDENYWISIIEKINESPWCLGQNDRCWRADFEFFTRPDTHYRVMEGKYNRKEKAPKQQKLVGHTSDGSPVYEWR